MDIIIRPAQTTDAFAIQALSVQLGYAPSVAETIDYIHMLNQSSADLICVAVQNNVVVGWMHVFYAVRLESGTFCELGGLVVNASHRGQGIGGTLIKAAMEWTKAKGCTKLKVRTNTVRTQTHQFYAGAGFTEVKQQKIFEMNTVPGIDDLK